VRVCVCVCVCVCVWVCVCVCVCVVCGVLGWDGMGWMDGWMDRWMDRWMDGWMERSRVYTHMHTGLFGLVGLVYCLLG
jgi:hypothetical protein